MTYEVGASVSVQAFHVMSGMEGPEGERHAHTYQIDAVVERGELDERGMVCDLDVLTGALHAIADRVDAVDLETVVASGGEAVTVEVFARWVHGRLAPPVAADGGETLAVRVWESPSAFGGYRAGVR